MKPVAVVGPSVRTGNLFRVRNSFGFATAVVRSKKCYNIMALFIRSIDRPGTYRIFLPSVPSPCAYHAEGCRWPYSPLRYPSCVCILSAAVCCLSAAAAAVLCCCCLLLFAVVCSVCLTLAALLVTRIASSSFLLLSQFLLLLAAPVFRCVQRTIPSSTYSTGTCIPRIHVI